MTTEDALALMKRFRKAYAKADKAELMAVTSADFEWHQHFANDSEQTPNGRTLHGVEALLEEIAWRQQHWTGVTYSDLQERLAGDDLLVQTFIIKGQEDGQSFYAKAVDLYPIEQGRITRKDTYWKFIKTRCSRTSQP